MLDDLKGNMLDKFALLLTTYMKIMKNTLFDELYLLDHLLVL